MVHSVVAVSSVDKVKRDAHKAVDAHSQKKQQESAFSQILEQTVEEQRTIPMECHTLTYGQDSRLHTFQYQMREYNY